MRESCLDCSRKHLAQACILMIEARLGYIDHRWLALGHLAEAETELVKDFLGEALTIREHRKAYEKDPDYDVPIMKLISRLTEREKEVSS